jgi:hypothetical protein
MLLAHEIAMNDASGVHILEPSLRERDKSKAKKTGRGHTRI